MCISFETCEVSTDWTLSNTILYVWWNCVHHNATAKYTLMVPTTAVKDSDGNAPLAASTIIWTTAAQAAH